MPDVRTQRGGARVAWVDSLRVAAITGVIVVHTATAYVTDFADWYYDDELRPTTVGFAVFAVPALLGARAADELAVAAPGQDRHFVRGADVRRRRVRHVQGRGARDPPHGRRGRLLHRRRHVGELAPGQRRFRQASGGRPASRLAR